MNKTVAVLVFAIVLLVGAVAYLLGQQNAPGANAEDPPPAPLATANEVATNETQGPGKPAATPTAAPEGGDGTFVVAAPPAVAGVQSPIAARMVMVGKHGATSRDCPIMGMVKTSVDADGGYLSVRAAPNSKAAEVARLKRNTGFFACDWDQKREWLGVVLPPPGGMPKGAACNVHTVSGNVHPYAGTCRSGWLYAKYTMPMENDYTEYFEE